MKRRWFGLLHLFAYILASFVWFAVLAGGAVLVADLNPELLGEASLEDLSRATTGEMAGIIGLFTIVQLIGMAVLAVVGAAFVPSGDGAPGLRRVGNNLALTGTSWGSAALGVVIGFFGGFFPSWLFQVLGEWLPEPMVDELIQTAVEGPLFAQVVMGLAVAVAAPVCEEIVFRGYLWSALEHYLHPAYAFVVTSVVFAAYHLDPVQALGVFPIALTLGWARWWTGSLWPAVLLHATNNGLALLASAAGPEVAEATVPAWLGIGSLAVTLACCVALFQFRAR